MSHKQIFLRVEPNHTGQISSDPASSFAEEASEDATLDVMYPVTPIKHGFVSTQTVNPSDKIVETPILIVNTDIRPMAKLSYTLNGQQTAYTDGLNLQMTSWGCLLRIKVSAIRSV